MGGQGSGRRLSSTRGRTHARLELKIHDLKRGGLLERTGTFAAGSQAPGQSYICMHNTGGAIELEYRIKIPDGVDLRRCYTIELSYSRCHKGGQRAWLLCPSMGCGKRTSSLFLNNHGYFTCRHCQRLVYTSQYERPDFRLISRADKIRAKLGWEAGILNPPGGKPPGMHCRTYLRLVLQYDMAVQAAFLAMMDRINRPLNGKT